MTRVFESQVSHLPDEMASQAIICISKSYVKPSKASFCSYLIVQPRFDVYGMFIKIFWNDYKEMKGTSNPTKIALNWLKDSQIDK